MALTVARRSGQLSPRTFQLIVLIGCTAIRKHNYPSQLAKRQTAIGLKAQQAGKQELQIP